MDSKEKELVLALREQLYNDRLELCKDDAQLLEHLKREHASCDKEELVDAVLDLILDSIGA